MSKAEWGMKRVCLGCGARYYDMKKNPPVCPSCGVTFDPENQMRSRRGRAAKVVEARPETVLDDIPVAGGDEAEDAVIEDVDELGDEEVEVGEVEEA